MATQKQKDQFIALAATKLKPEILDHDRFQVFLKDPEGFDRFADEFIGKYECNYPSVATIDFTTTFPDWSKGRVLNGNIRRWKEIDFLTVMSSAYFHPRQTGEKNKDDRPTGEEILASLVTSYEPGKDKKGNTYNVVETDLIHGHFGRAELIYMKKNWLTLPKPFKAWAKGRILYGWRDVIRDDRGDLRVLDLNCHIDKPCVRWDYLDSPWYAHEPALRMQSTQS